MGQFWSAEPRDSRTETDMARAADMNKNKKTTKPKTKTGPRAATTKKKPTGPRGVRTKKKADRVLLAGSKAFSISQSTESAAAGPIGVGTVLTAADGTSYMVTAVDGTGPVVFGRCNSPAPGPGPDPDPLGDTAEFLKGTDGTNPETESSYYYAHLERIADEPLPELTDDDILSCLRAI